APAQAPTAPAGTAAAERPAPPAVQQLAPVAIALALGPGHAPRLSVTLAPEHLGRVEIRIERDAAGETASIQVLAERPETLALLQRDARELDRALGQAGVTVAEGGMRFDLSGNDAGPTGQGAGEDPGTRRHGFGRQRAAAPQTAPAAARHGLVLSLLDIAV
ncbi:MAG: flagellar hook-length control protein FliK, partial [Paracraurococcus sp.]